MSTSRAQSIVSSRMSSRKSSRRDSRLGSMDEEEIQKIVQEEAKPRTNGGKIINKLGKGEQQDSG